MLAGPCWGGARIGQHAEANRDTGSGLQRCRNVPTGRDDSARRWPWRRSSQQPPAQPVAYSHLRHEPVGFQRRISAKPPVPSFHMSASVRSWMFPALVERSSVVHGTTLPSGSTTHWAMPAPPAERPVAEQRLPVARSSRTRRPSSR